MNTLSALSLLVDGFGWALVLVVFAASVAFAFRDSLVLVLERTIDYDGLDVEEVATIEEARAELARRHRERAAKSAQEAEAARFETFAAFAQYLPAWEGDWEAAAVARLQSATVPQLVLLKGIGPNRARRIVDLGSSLTLENLRRICTAPVATHAMLSV